MQCGQSCSCHFANAHEVVTYETTTRGVIRTFSWLKVGQRRLCREFWWKRITDTLDTKIAMYTISLDDYYIQPIFQVSKRYPFVKPIVKAERIQLHPLKSKLQGVYTGGLQDIIV